MASRSPSVLLVVHALPPAERSGTPLAAYGYAQTLGAAGWDVTVLSAQPGAAPWERAQPARDATEPFARLVVPPDYGGGASWLDAWSVALPAGGSLGPNAPVARMLERLDPDLVHVVDNVFLPPSVSELAHRMGVPVVRGVSCAEDLCALVVPVSPCSGPDGFCEPPLTVDHCADCVSHATTDDLLEGFRQTGDASVDSQRRARLRELLGAQRARAAHHFGAVYDRVVFASEQFRTYFEQTLPLDPHRTRVVPMGVDVPVGRQRRPPRGGGPLTFLVAGNTNPFKGTSAVVSAFMDESLAARDDWRLLLAGGGDRRLYGSLLEDPRVEDRGPYDERALAELLSQADVGVSASIFETFHRVTREYLAGGLPVVGSRAFGISDVVVDGRNGLLFDHGDEQDLRRALVRLLEDRSLVDQLGAGAAATRIRSVAEEVAELVSIYEEVIAERLGRR